MFLWLDDIRPAPDGWRWAKSVDEAIGLLCSKNVTDASLDHDLGYFKEGEDRTEHQLDSPAHYPEWLFQYDNTVREGIDLVKWMCEENIWPSETLAVHSANYDGARRMCGLIEQFGPYAQKLSFKQGHLQTWGVKYYG